MAIKKILIVYKNSLLKKVKAKKRTDFLGVDFLKTLNQADQKHQETIEKLTQTLKKFPFEVEWAHRKNITLDGFDLVITVGGDGTVLKASHIVTNQPLLGINSAPDYSVGALCSITPDQIEEKLGELQNQNYQLISYPRLKVVVNGQTKKVGALNDILYANQSPAGTSRYLVGLKNKVEEQKSSGVWIATALGSTAAIGASGGQKIAKDSLKFQYKVREPYYFDHKNYDFLGEVLPANEPLNITNHCLPAALFIDGVRHAIPLDFGDRVQITNDFNPLKVVV